MKLTSFLDPVGDEAIADSGLSALSRRSRILRSRPPGKNAPAKKRLPEPPPLGVDDDRVSVSLEATYLMVGDKFDPRFLTPNQLSDMTEIMLAGRAIDRSEQALLMKGPKGRGYPVLEAGTARNIIADWQDQLARSVGRSDLAGVSRATRALGILGRVAVTRMP